MDNSTSVIDGILRFLGRFQEAAMSILTLVEAWLHDQLTILGVAPQYQTILLSVIAFFLILSAVRLFAGFVRVAIVCILILIGLHILVPGLGA